MTVLDYDTFNALLTQPFSVRLTPPKNGSGIDGLTLELTAVEQGRQNKDCDSFSLIFNGPGHCFLPQRLYPLHHDALGEHEIFLVPVGETRDPEDQRRVTGYQYQAVFSRLKSREGLKPIQPTFNGGKL